MRLNSYASISEAAKAVGKSRNTMFGWINCKSGTSAALTKKQLADRKDSKWLYAKGAPIQEGGERSRSGEGAEVDEESVAHSRNKHYEDGEYSAKQNVDEMDEMDEMYDDNNDDEEEEDVVGRRVRAPTQKLIAASKLQKVSGKRHLYQCADDEDDSDEHQHSVTAEAGGGDVKGQRERGRISASGGRKVDLSKYAVMRMRPVIQVCLKRGVPNTLASVLGTSLLLKD